MKVTVIKTDANEFNVRNLTVGEKMELIGDLESAPVRKEVDVAKNSGVVV